MTTNDSTSRPRLLTGDRPTGPLHLGHLVGSLQKRVELQDSHDCFLIVADLHSLTTRPQPERIGQLSRYVRSIVLDWLSVGIDPERTTIYLQSGVPAVYDLTILLQMLTPQARVRDMGSLLEMAQNAGINDDKVSLGLMGYPVLQAADILMAQAEVIPVGADNLSHVEIAGELADFFNQTYGEIFPKPKAMSSRVALLPGIGKSSAGATKRRKMSKSAGNTIDLTDTDEMISAKMATVTGDSLSVYVDAFIVDSNRSQELKAELQTGKVDEAKVQSELAQAIIKTLEPIRERRSGFEANDGLIDEIVVDGTIKARQVAYQTLQRVRETMGLEGLWQGFVQATEARAERRKAEKKLG